MPSATLYPTQTSKVAALQAFIACVLLLMVTPWVGATQEMVARVLPAPDWRSAFAPPIEIPAPRPREHLLRDGEGEGWRRWELSWRETGSRVLQRLARDSQEPAMPSSLVILRSPAIHAFSEGTAEVVISSGLLDLVTNSSELAFVLAHEAGHLALGHLHGTVTKGEAFRGQCEREKEADAFAMDLLRKAGFDVEVCASLLRRIVENGKARGFRIDRVYPSLPPRIEAIQQRLALLRSTIG